MDYWIGIDGGGTSSRLILVNGKKENIILVNGKSTNIYAEDEKALTNIQNIINEALKNSRVKAQDVKGVCLGSAGFGMGRRDDDEKAEKAIREVLPNSKIKITTDAHILLTGSTGGKENAMILIAGTGSIALGKRGNKVIRAGGLGWRLGDEGSAWWISKEAIVRSYAQKEKRAYLNYADSSLLSSLLEVFNLKKIEDFVQFLNSSETSKSDVAKGAKVVTNLAKRGELISKEIIEDAASELFSFVLSIIRRLGEEEKYFLVLYGGEFEHDEALKASLINKVNSLKTITILPPQGSALDGAIIEAMSL